MEPISVGHEVRRWRVLGHLAAVLIAAPETSLLHHLRCLMLETKGKSMNATEGFVHMDG